MSSRHFFVPVVAALALVVAACGQRRAGRTSARPEYLGEPGGGALDLPFSEAVRFGDMIYLSGQVGTRPGSLDLVPGGIVEETRQTMENIGDVLERHGSSFDRVVKCTVFLADIEEWPAMNQVYRTFFDGPPPARSALAGSGLALGARVEIECIAAVGD